jgi:hypothetical protein
MRLQDVIMLRKCIALLSGGLDSMLATRLMQEQGIEIEAVTFQMIYSGDDSRARRAAEFLQVPLTVFPPHDDFLEVIRHPRFGYGKGANPCLDCRIYMLGRAAAFAQEVGADFVISGEVLGQRLMSQKRRDFGAVAHHSGLGELLLRPLCAKLLPPTRPEVEGWVDRQQLYGFHGRGRKGLIRLARRLGFPFIPPRLSGCALTEPRFSRNVLDLLEFDPQATAWDFELLRVGRHYRLDSESKVVVGRRQSENEQLERLHESSRAGSSTLLVPDNFVGPAALLVGPCRPPAVSFAAGLVWRHARRCDPQTALIRVFARDAEHVVGVEVSDAVERARTLASTAD